ncbi:hypothetical protein MycrhDRAFT_1413 [Mycolicibacterium rhodesiae JS60]|nr:hypothetical protein MycrhDRAFT_1413 [Mycolicibacterium rhodesiae JS60]
MWVPPKDNFFEGYWLFKCPGRECDNNWQWNPAEFYDE